MTQRSPWPRAMAFAALGAANVLSVRPDNASARSLLSDAADAMTGPGHQPGWPWPEPRLTYANAVLPEAMIAAGSALDRPALLRRGLDLLEWLLVRETRRRTSLRHPSRRKWPEDRGPDSINNRLRWRHLPMHVPARLTLTATTVEGRNHGRRDWFLGDNDAAVVMWDPHTGGGFDGLQRSGANRTRERSRRSLSYRRCSTPGAVQPA